jgi:translation initiation factor IF-2
MKKMRVYELAKKAGISVNDLIIFLKRRGFDIKNHMSVIDEETVAAILGVKPKQKEQVKEKQEEKVRVEGTQEKPETVEEKKAIEEEEKVVIEQEAEAHEVLEEVEIIPEPQSEPIVYEAEEEEEEKEVDLEEERERKRLLEEEELQKKLLRPKKKKKKKKEEIHEIEEGKEIILPEGATVGEFTAAIGKSSSEVIKHLMDLGLFLTITQPIDPEAAKLIAEEYGLVVEFKSEVSELLTPDTGEDDEKFPEEPRPPVVTVMGHVDHGKTTLLDTIRKTNVVATEHGGITQHIGAYTVEHNGRMVTFIDTPGHEAFTKMRARGAQVTDVAVLVVAADDGVMPQTIEAIDHAKAAGVPIVVAVNKIDKPDANPDLVKSQLSEKGLIPEEWGGDTIFVPVSAKLGTNIEELLEMILLVADMKELKARKKGRATGTVIESKLEKGRGPVATLLIKKGELRVGDPIVCGTAYGKIRAMFDDKGRSIKAAYPAMPVEVLGLSEAPEAGTEFYVVEDEKAARRIAEERALKIRVAETMRRKALSLEELFEAAREGELETLNIIVKADTQGSLEAVEKALLDIKVENVRLNIIHGAVGGITEADVMLAAASNAIVIGFNVRPDSKAKDAAQAEKVDVRTYRIIYDLIDEVKAALAGMLKPEFIEEEIGQAEVRAVFKVPKVGKVAGCYVTQGRITRNAKVRLVRQGVIVYDGTIASLKRFKEDVNEVKAGFECGIGLDGFQDVKEGDIIEAYQIVEKPREIA